MNLLRRLYSWIQGHFGSKKEVRFKLVRCEDEPDEIPENEVFVLGSKGHEWAAMFICPCGCRQVIQLNMLKAAGRPRWSIRSGKMGSASIVPSVWRHVGCKSHFVMTDGLIHWCLNLPNSDGD